MKKILLFIISLLFVVHFSNINAQSLKIDSLKNLLNTQIHDTIKVDVLLKIVNKLSGFDNNEAIEYANMALNTSMKANYIVGIADSYLRLSDMYILTGRFDSCSINCQKAMKIYQELNLLQGQLNCYNDLSLIEYYRGNTIKSIEYSKKALEYAEKTNNKHKKGKIYNNIGLMYSNKGLYDSAIVYAFNALKIFEDINDSININGSYINIGGYYLHLKDSANTINYLNKGVQFSNELNDQKGLCICYSNLAEFYTNYRQFDTAIAILALGIEIDKKLNDQYGLAIDIKSLATIYKLQGKYDEAIKKLAECSEIQKSMKNEHGLMLTNYELADIYFRLKEYSKAEKYAKLSLKATRKLKEKDSEQYSIKLLSDIYSQTNNYTDAYKYLLKSDEIKDSLFNIEKLKQIEELNLKYQTAKKEKENTKLLYKNNLQNTEIEYQKKMRFFYLSILVLLFAFSIYILTQYRKKNRTYRALFQKNTELISKEKELTKLKKEKKELSIKEEKQQKYSDDKKEELLTKIEYEFNQNKIYKNDINLKEFANHINTNTSYLSDIFNNYHKKTFTEFVNNYRVQETINLMTNKEYQKYTLTAIGEMSGFSSEKTFNRVFKKNTGLTPGFYRKNLNIA